MELQFLFSKSDCPDIYAAFYVYRSTMGIVMLMKVPVSFRNILSVELGYGLQSTLAVLQIG